MEQICPISLNVESQEIPLSHASYEYFFVADMRENADAPEDLTRNFSPYYHVPPLVPIGIIKFSAMVLRTNVGVVKTPIKFFLNHSNLTFPKVS